ncbi:hypothetical protein [Pseudomonas sp. 460]|uniref:hypothetical protein n=1 Tax=Pseudomonas sp. 460 TaxID=2485142 RepID=UPI00104CC34A|nr:hypothetical protein [Pseudomonas sp. 460]
MALDPMPTNCSRERLLVLSLLSSGRIVKGKSSQVRKTPSKIKELDVMQNAKWCDFGIAAAVIVFIGIAAFWIEWWVKSLTH